MPFVSDPSPIMFHQNLNNPLEWVTAQESGLLMANVCEHWIPDSFWRRAYNIGGGSKWRLTLWQMYEMYFGHLGLDYQQVFETRDFGIYNFHGQWFADSDALNEIAKFRYLDPEQFFRKEMRNIRAIRCLPLLRRLIPNERRMKQMLDKASQEHGGTKWMFDRNKEDWITVFFGSGPFKN